jgi:hypothetical protein
MFRSKFLRNVLGFSYRGPCRLFSEPTAVTQSSIQVEAGSRTTTSATITWTKVTVGNFDSYHLTIDGGKITATVAKSETPSAATTILTAGKEYKVDIRTKYGDHFSASVSFTFKSRKFSIYLISFAGFSHFETQYKILYLGLFLKCSRKYRQNTVHFLSKIHLKKPSREKNPNRIMYYKNAHKHNHDLLDRNNNK